MAACSSISVSPRRPRSRARLPPRLLAYGKALWVPAPSFVAIDLRTASRRRDSLCAVGAVRVERGVVVDRFARLVRPPTPFVDRGMRPVWRDLTNAAPFRELWPSLRAFLHAVDFVAAHDVSSVSSVLDASCEREGLPTFDGRYEHTASLARRVWDIDVETPAALALELGLPWRPDDVLSTAETCADVVLAAWAA
jgi:DNA polymerase III subunit epsilon